MSWLPPRTLDVPLPDVKRDEQRVPATRSAQLSRQIDSSCPALNLGGEGAGGAGALADLLRRARSGDVATGRVFPGLLVPGGHDGVVPCTREEGGRVEEVGHQLVPGAVLLSRRSLCCGLQSCGE